MTKIGNTDGYIYSMFLQQILVWPLFGHKIAVDFPPPIVGKESAITFSIEYQDDDIKIEPNVELALRAASRIASAAGRGEIKSVEKLPVQDDEEVKFVITIRKR